MDFTNFNIDKVDSESYLNPETGEAVLIDFLNDNFGDYETATEMKDNTDSEGLKKFFDYLVDEGKLEE